MRKSSSHCSFIAEHSSVDAPVAPDRKSWSLLDATDDETVKPILPLASFNHIAREVINIEKSKNFYCDLLGFVVVPRPPFECKGYWLWGYGLSLHIVETIDKLERKSILRARYSHFTKALPRVDHFAFMTTDIHRVKSILEEANVYFTHETPPDTGFEQIFFFDPDGNVIEVSTCSAKGEGWCSKNNGNSSGATAFASIRSVTSPRTPTSPPTQRENETPAEELVRCAVTESSPDMIDAVTLEGNLLQFQFDDGTTDFVELQEVVVKSSSDYRYEESDFLKSRTISEDTDRVSDE